MARLCNISCQEIVQPLLGLGDTNLRSVPKNVSSIAGPLNLRCGARNFGKIRPAFWQHKVQYTKRRTNWYNIHVAVRTIVAVYLLVQHVQ